MHILRRPFRGKMTNTPVGLGDGRYSDRPFRKRYPSVPARGLQQAPLAPRLVPGVTAWV